jgi:hypothetical protein
MRPAPRLGVSNDQPGSQVVLHENAHREHPRTHQPEPGDRPGAIPERELQDDLIAAENAELSRLFEAGTITAATRRRLRRRLEITRLTDEQR